MSEEGRAQALVMRVAADQIDSYYPIEVWPEPTAEQIAALHVFARSIGMADGSRFHVNGIRHAARLFRIEADLVEEQSRDGETE